MVYALVCKTSLHILCLVYTRVVQSVERHSDKVEVEGPSPSPSTYLCGGDVKYEPNNLKVVSANLFKANHLKWVQKTMTFSTLCFSECGSVW